MILYKVSFFIIVFIGVYIDNILVALSYKHFSAGKKLSLWLSNHGVSSHKQRYYEHLILLKRVGNLINNIPPAARSFCKFILNSIVPYNDVLPLTLLLYGVSQYSISVAALKEGDVASPYVINLFNGLSFKYQVLNSHFSEIVTVLSGFSILTFIIILPGPTNLLNPVIRSWLLAPSYAHSNPTLDKTDPPETSFLHPFSLIVSPVGIFIVIAPVVGMFFGFVTVIV